VGRMVGRVMARTASGLGMVFGVTVVLFWAMVLLPGDPAARVLGTGATPDRLAALQRELGLDRPATERYLDWLVDAVHGDLGLSLVSRSPVTDLVGPRLVNTLLLVALAATIAATIALAAGVAAGLRAGSSRDRMLSGAGLVGVSVPDFVIAGLLLTVVGFGLGWLPPTCLVAGGGRPWDDPRVLVLPVVSLAIPTGSWLFRYVRSGVAAAAGSDHVEAARLAGLRPRAVVFRHLLPAAVIPSMQAFGYAGASLLGGTLVVEQVFSYPGLGQAMVDAVSARDAPVVLAIGVLLSVAVAAAFTLADLVSAMLDPRLRRPEHR
jgi:peptide/nickel transport system permease protein